MPLGEATSQMVLEFQMSDAFDGFQKIDKALGKVSPSYKGRDAREDRPLPLLPCHVGGCIEVPRLNARKRRDSLNGMICDTLPGVREVERTEGRAHAAIPASMLKGQGSFCCLVFDKTRKKLAEKEARKK